MAAIDTMRDDCAAVRLCGSMDAGGRRGSSDVRATSGATRKRFAILGDGKRVSQGLMIGGARVGVKSLRRRLSSSLSAGAVKG